MRIGIATRNPRAWCSSRLREAFNSAGAEVLCVDMQRVAARIGLPPTVSQADLDLASLDALLIRPIGRGSLDEIIVEMDILHTLAGTGLLLINNPSTIEKTVDKYRALTLLAADGIPVPRTVVTQNVREALTAFHALGGDVVVKPVFGSRGIGVSRVSDPDIAERVFRTIRFHRHVLYLQEYVEHGTADVRAFVVGGTVVASMTRRSTGWKTNISRGASATPLAATPEINQLAIRAAEALGCSVAGVDILQTDSGLCVNEVNSQPGWRGLQSVAKADIAREIADFVISQTRN